MTRKVFFLVFALLVACYPALAAQNKSQQKGIQEVMKAISEFVVESLRFDRDAKRFVPDQQELQRLAAKALAAYGAGVSLQPGRSKALQDALVRHVSGIAARFTDPGEAPRVQQLIRSLLTNQALLRDLLTMTAPGEDELLETYLGLHTERMLQTSEKYVPHRPTQQLLFPDKVEGAVQIVPEKFLLVGDFGTSGNQNGAIDAGETIVLNISLKNCTQDRAYRSTSCFLESDDTYVAIQPQEVVYDYRPEIPTIEEWPSGKEVSPKENFILTIAGDCPDQHVVPFRLLIWDSKWGKAYQKFSLRVYNVGPLTFGDGVVDDDIPGPSEGDGDGLIEPGEKIEFVLGIKNDGAPSVENVVAELSAEAAFIHFTEARRPYPSIKPRAVGEVVADFDFAVDTERGVDSDKVVLVLRADAKAYAVPYHWERLFAVPVGLAS